MDQYVRLAKEAIETYVKEGKILPLPASLPKEMTEKKAGVFVSIHKKSGELRGLPRRRAPRGRERRPRREASVLRGCIGTFLPTKKNIAEEIIMNAIAAATEDPRFPPVMPSELPDLKISVDVLSEPKLVPSTYPLNPKRYGLIVSTPDGRRGLLLPDIPGVETAEQQITICRRKAGIGSTEMVKYSIFTVKRHG
jgi:AmmeMemoRadiSam system protein A